MIKQQEREIENEFSIARSNLAMVKENQVSKDISKDISWEVKYDGFGILAEGDRSYNILHYLDVRVSKKNLVLKKRLSLSSKEIMDRLLENLIDSLVIADIEAPWAEETEEELVIHMFDYSSIGINTFGELNDEMTYILKVIQEALDDLQVMQADIKVYFEVKRS